jgi:aspartate/methionine/tyrosine aminotransferase
MKKQRFVLSWDNKSKERSLSEPFLSGRIKSVMASPHAMWNYMSYRDAIKILGMKPEEIYKDGRVDLDPADWADLGWMTCYAGPPESAVKAMREQTTSENMNPYTPDLINPVRDACARIKYKRQRSDMFEVIGTEGAQAGISYTLQTFLNPGEEVIITDPGYFHFESAILMAGGVPVRIPLGEHNGYRLNPDEVERAITPRTKILLVCNPLNPFGTVQTKSELIALAERTKERNILIIDDFTHNTHRIDPGAVHYTITSLWEETDVDHVISTFSISHGYGMAGVRLGFLAGHPDLMRACLMTKVALTRLNTNLISQHGALAAIKDEEYVKQSEALIRRNYAHVKETVHETPCITIPVEPQYGFSMVIDVSGTGVSAQELTVALFKRRVAVYPGDGLGDVGATDYIRLNISRPDIWALEHFRESLPEAVSEAKTGLYKEGVRAFFEEKGTERARKILGVIKNK